MEGLRKSMNHSDMEVSTLAAIRNLCLPITITEICRYTSLLARELRKMSKKERSNKGNIFIY
jgi:hypothetical protein